MDGIFTLDDDKLLMLLFADDAVLFAYKPETLQAMINDVNAYCEKWLLKINTAKTKVMIFETGRHTEHTFYISDQPLENVHSFKYLGIHFHKNIKWHRTQQTIAQRAAYALHNIFTVFNQIEITTSQKCKLFDSLVGSILNYCSGVWGNIEANDIETIHKKF